MSEQVFKKAINEFGLENQIRQTFEELGELIVALNKRVRYGLKFDDSVAEEVADVQIMLEQIILIFEIKELVETWRNHKMKRLQLLVESGNPNDNPCATSSFVSKEEKK